MYKAPLSLQKLRPLLFLGCLFFLAAYLKAYFESRSAFLQAETLLSQGKIREAIRHYTYALRWYTPGSAYPQTALRRIFRLGEHAYTSGDWDGALFCFQQLHASLASIRSFFQPFPQEIKEAQRFLLILLDFMPSRVGPSAPSPQIRQERFSRSLQAHPPPPLFLSISLFALFASSFSLLLSILFFPLPSPSRRPTVLLIFVLLLASLSSVFLSL